MTKNDTYSGLEKQFVTYKELQTVEVRESNDVFICLPETCSKKNGVIGHYEAEGNRRDVFPLIAVRKEVKTRLDTASAALKEISHYLQLIVVDGYRSLEVQQDRFELQKQDYILRNNLDSNTDINEIIHRMIAVPDVAGHPTGGAVDVVIEDIRTGSKLDFGTTLFDFESKDIYTFSPFVNQVAQNNRSLLRQLMTNQGFAPYDGEWWHFSFGDKEWAYYYKKPNALYKQIPVKVVLDAIYKKPNIIKKKIQP